MKYKIMILLLILTVALTACASSQASQSNPVVVNQAPTATASANSADQTNSTTANITGTPAAQNGPGANPSSDNQLVMGTLKLEGTSLAITADQAKTLLPLWQKIKTLTADTTTTTDTLQTAYKQIESAMTSDQLAAIQKMSLSQTDMQSLITSLGIQITPGAGPSQNGTPPAMPKGTPGAQGGKPGAQGTPPAMPQGTPDPNNPNGGGPGGAPGGGMSTAFVDALIKILQQRAGA